METVMRLALALVLLLVAAPAAQARSAPCGPGGFSPTCRVWTGKVVFVDDGDTVDVDLDGDGGHTPRRVRITGIQAMEQTVYSSVVSRRRGACGALEATSRLERMLRAAHWRVRLTAQDPTKTSRGRLQRSVAARLGGRWVDVGDVLVREGRAL